MKIILNEEILTEGKNLQQTLDRYRDKFKKLFDQFETSDDEADKLMLSVIRKDPTYQAGGTTTGDYGIWLLNQELKDNIQKFEATKDISITDLLNEFIEKKANLANKDLNSYKSPDELYKLLSEVQLTDRQKERKLRKDISGAKHVGSTANFDIYIPETYEASCALGKGSGWCTADSRTRQYFDYYKDRYGGNYYIIISKDGKYKYQLHFESQQYSAAGTNPDINNPNEEEMLEYEDIISKWPELKDVLNDIKAKGDPSIVIRDMLSEIIGSEELTLQLSIDDISKYINLHNSLLQWFITDITEIPPIRVMKEVFNNKEVFSRWVSIINQRDKNQILESEELEQCTYSAFQFKLLKRIQTLKISANNAYLDNTSLKFSVFGGKGFVYRLSLMDLAHDMLDGYGSEYLKDLISHQEFDELESWLNEAFPQDDKSRFTRNILYVTKDRLKDDLDKIPSMIKAYFSSESTLLFFYEDFEDNIIDLIDEKRFTQQSTED